MQNPAGSRSLPRLLGQLGLVFILLTLFVPRTWPLQRVEFPGIYNELTSLNLRLADGGFLLLLLAFLWPIGPRQWPALRRSPIWLPLCALVVLAAISLTWAREPILAWQYTIYLVLLLACFYLIHWLAPAPRLIQGTLLLALAGQSVVAGLQFWRQADLGLYWLGEVDLNRYPGGGSILAVGEQFWLRAYGLTNHPNLLGGFLALAILLLLGGSLRPGRLAWALRLGLTVGCAALVLSFSRAAWLGLMAGFLFLALLLGSRASWRRQYGRSLLLGAAFCFLGGLLALIPTRDLLFTRLQPTVNEFEIRSFSEREALRAAAWAAYGAAPWTGVGAGNGTVAVAPLIGEQAAAAPQPVHHVPLLLLLELGPAGATLWLLLMVVPPGYTLYLCWRQPDRVTPWLLALSAALLAYGLIDFYDYYAWGWASGRYWRWLLWAFWSLALSYRPADAQSGYDNAASISPDPGDPHAQNK